MDAILAQISHLQEQARTQAASIAQLSCTVARQTTQLEAPDSTIVRLTAQNQAQLATNARLSPIVQDQDRVIGELVRTSSTGGFWVWESRREVGREDEGRWLWSLEKYKALPSLSVASGPPTSLLSLPIELLDATFELLSEEDQISLCEVSFRIFEVASKYVFGGKLGLDYEAACSFLSMRLDDPQSRIAPFLQPTAIYLLGDSPSLDESTHQLLASASLFLDPPQSFVDHIGLCFANELDLEKWNTILRLTNPRSFQLVTHAEPKDTLRSVRFVPRESVTSFSSSWTRLRAVFFTGPSSVLLADGTPSTSAFEDCLRRCSPASTPRVRLLRLKGTTRMETVKEMKSGRSIASFLAEKKAVDGDPEDDIGLELSMMKDEDDGVEDGGRGMRDVQV